MDLVKNTVNKFNENVFKFLYLLNKNLQKILIEYQFANEVVYQQISGFFLGLLKVLKLDCQ